jgi:hypothetical protein
MRKGSIVDLLSFVNALGILNDVGLLIGDVFWANLGASGEKGKSAFGADSVKLVKL